MNRLIQGDCLELMQDVDHVDCIFADPPDNIGAKYGEYADKKDPFEYVRMMSHWLRSFTAKADTVWFSFNSKWQLEFGGVVRDHLLNYPEIKFKPFVQMFTFGQYRANDCGSGYRPLWRFQREGAQLYPNQIKVPSWRLLHGDKRASPDGKVPSDVWAFPIVPGNSRQRRSWHPTQLNEGLVERAIKMTTQEGGTVLDPFAGTGTTMRVCKRINRDCTLFEIDKNYCDKIAGEHNLER